MARPTTVHVCSQCGHSSVRWHGQCPGCNEWNTLVEERAPATGAGGGRGAAARAAGGGGAAACGPAARCAWPTSAPSASRAC